MVDYYKTLGVERTATTAEIKSAYRRLARRAHPDVNNGSEHSARKFALLALAYRTLSDPQERAAYDAKCEKERQQRSGFVLNSDNIHARRMRMVTAQARCDRVVDLLLEADRRANTERSQAVFTTVTLFFSTFIVAMLKPKFWQIGVMGRGVVIALFIVGLWHLASRLREYFARYTYKPEQIHVSIMTEGEKSEKPFTRFSAYVFLVVGYIISVAAGLLAAEQLHYVMNDLAFIFDQNVRPNLVFYPPIAVLLVDTMHSLASKIDS
ncbi:MAG TPA: DnaJ domain-containing protein [Pyrinomonadaceae bacterium]|nr:DnaJ domain-containing protein [Pyrinomonadaceae bacterium]